MIRDRNIVCVASSWYDHPTSKHHVMRRLAEHNHVLWLNYHASRRPQLNRGDAQLIVQRLRRVFRGPQRVAPQLDVLSPLVLPFPTQPLARRLNGLLLATQVRRALARLPRRPLQVWLFTPDAPELLRHLRAERVVYYCVDEFSAFTGFDRALMDRLEARTLAAADVVLATSEKLYADRVGRHPRVHLAPHGVDFAHFAAARRVAREEWPADLRDLPRPVFGYMGLISDYVDLDLLATAARKRPDWSFALLGDQRCPVDVLRGLPNVHLLGGKAYEELPRYCAAFDVGLIPFRMNRLTVAVNPIKLREYLAAGLPVVSSPMPAVRHYAAGVRFAESAEEFVAAGEAALDLGRTQAAAARQALVREESWEARVAQIADLVMERRATGAATAPSTPQQFAADATPARGMQAESAASNRR